MADLLGEVDTNTIQARSHIRKAIKSETRRKVRILSPPPTQQRQRKNDPLQLIDPQPLQLTFADDDGILNAMDDQENLPMSDPLPSSPIAKVVARKATLKAQQQQEKEEEEEVEADEDMS